MLQRYFVLIFVFCFMACSTPSKNPHIEIQTKAGDIELELYAGQAPVTVKAFLSFVDSGMYKNAHFYRVLNDENQPSDAFKASLIQGGIWRSSRKRAEALPGIPHESTQQTNIKHTNGVISLARLAPGSANAEFFIVIGDQPGFDYGGDNNPDKQGYAAFGKVVKGMDVVLKIYRAPESDQVFTPLLPIYDIKKL